MVRNSYPTEWEVLLPLDEGDEWGYRAAYKPDMLVRLRWGRVSVESLDEDWSNRVTSPENNRTEYVEVLYAGQPVERVVVANVDGLKCYSPIPRNPVSVEVTEWDFKLARLLQQMTDGGSYLSSGTWLRLAAHHPDGR